ncbi:MAG: hypothetical protein AB7I08_15555 [Thermoleophilia bacterium]
MSTTRLAPFHCPYCGEGDLRPGGNGLQGLHWCPDCDRRFGLRFAGLGPDEITTDQGDGNDHSST